MPAPEGGDDVRAALPKELPGKILSGTTLRLRLRPTGGKQDDHCVLTKAQLQRLRSLREKKEREEQGVFVIEGEKVVGELLRAGLPLLEIYATDDWATPELLPPTRGSNAAPKFVRVSASEMARASHFPTPSTVLAVGPIRVAALAPGALERGLTLALDGVQDAGNVGTLLRIADWFGFERVVLSPDCADTFHQKVINASMGSFARVATHRVDLAAALNQLTAGTPIYGCDLEGTCVYALPPASNAVVVIGSEGRGLSPAIAARITQRVTIPRFGGAESLNAAVAAGIVCAQLRRSSAPGSPAVSG